MSREQKRNYEQRQKEGGDRNERFTEMLESSEETVSAQMLHKLRIWEEQKDGARLICPLHRANHIFQYGSVCADRD